MTCGAAAIPPRRQDQGQERWLMSGTLSVMSAARPEDAAGELARVCRKGGRLGLVTWLPGDTIADLFKMMGSYLSPPADPPPSAFEWGRRERLRELLGARFDLKFEGGI